MFILTLPITLLGHLDKKNIFVYKALKLCG